MQCRANGRPRLAIPHCPSPTPLLLVLLVLLLLIFWSWTDTFLLHSSAHSAKSGPVELAKTAYGLSVRAARLINQCLKLEGRGGVGEVAGSGVWHGIISARVRTLFVMRWQQPCRKCHEKSVSSWLHSRANVARLCITPQAGTPSQLPPAQPRTSLAE